MPRVTRLLLLACCTIETTAQYGRYACMIHDPQTGSRCGSCLERFDCLDVQVLLDCGVSTGQPMAYQEGIDLQTQDKCEAYLSATGGQDWSDSALQDAHAGIPALTHAMTMAVFTNASRLSSTSGPDCSIGRVLRGIDGKGMLDCINDRLLKWGEDALEKAACAAMVAVPTAGVALAFCASPVFKAAIGVVKSFANKFIEEPIVRTATTVEEAAAHIVSKAASWFKGLFHWRSKWLTRVPPRVAKAGITEPTYSPELGKSVYRMAHAAYCTFDKGKSTSSKASDPKAWTTAEAGCAPCADANQTVLTRHNATHPIFKSETPWYDIRGGSVAYFIAALRDNRDGRERIVLSFRGTMPWHFETVMTDLMLVSTHPKSAFHGCKECAVHGAIWRAWVAVRADIESALKVFRATYAEAPLLITGHSLGGALATFAAINTSYTVGELYTYGAPRVGNAAFEKYFAATAGFPTWRVTHARDVVPHLFPGRNELWPHFKILSNPTWWFDWVHSPTEVFYDSNTDQPTKICSRSNGEDTECAGQPAIAQHIFDIAHCPGLSRALECCVEHFLDCSSCGLFDSCNGLWNHIEDHLSYMGDMYSLDGPKQYPGC